MKILITGAAGFIASHVADAYIELGHEVVIIDNLVTGSKENLNSKAIFYQMDICDPRVEDIFANEKPDIVNHHAAQVSVPYSIEHPLFDVEVNVKGLVNILECSVKNRVEKFIYISSGGATYGEATEYPTTENYQPKPLSVYAINKMVGESYLYFYSQQYGLDYTVLRYANVYGPRQVSHGEAGVVSLFIEQLLNKTQPKLNRYSDQPEGMIRDYVFVADVVRANIAALDKGSKDVFNIGTCIPTSTLELYNLITKSMSITTNPIFCEARKGDLRFSLLSIDKAKRVLDWKPETDLETGITHVIDYFTRRKEEKED